MKMTTKTPIEWDGNGCAFQGDVVLMRLPQNFKFNKSPKALADGALILAEGEVTGHHHAIWNPQPHHFHDGALARSLETATPAKSSKKANVGTCVLHVDKDNHTKLVNEGKILDAEIAIGILEVSGEPVVLQHDEHDPIRIPPGLYYVGGQKEWDHREVRRVQD